MAGMTGGPQGGPDHGPDEIRDEKRATLSARAIRVTLAPGSAHAGLDPCLVEPGDDNGTILIDGVVTNDVLSILDAERTMLASQGDVYRLLLLEPQEPSTGDRGGQRREVVVDGWRVLVELEPEVRAQLRARARRGRVDGLPSGPTEVRAMIPGVVIAVSVVPGDTVMVGQELVIIEAMKMQNELRAPREGRIERVAVGAGTRIEVGDLLLVIT